MHRQRILLMKDGHPHPFMGKERGRAGLQKNFHFLEKIVHTLLRFFLRSLYLCHARFFLSHSVDVSFPTKVISIGISSPAAIPLFIIVPVTLQLAYDPGKRRGTCLTSCLGKEAHVEQLDQ